MKVGDLVMLNSGGPTMTVVKMGEEVVCSWFIDAEVRDAPFPRDALLPVSSEFSDLVTRYVKAARETELQRKPIRDYTGSLPMPEAQTRPFYETRRKQERAAWDLLNLLSMPWSMTEVPRPPI